MPRPTTITEEIIENAVKALQAKGIKPTNLSVKQAIGYGSFATIQPLFKKVMASLNPVEYFQNTDFLNPILVSAKGVVQKAITDATQSFRDDIDRLNQDIDTATMELIELQSFKTEAEKENETLKSELERMRGKLESSEQSLVDSRAESEKYREQNVSLRLELGQAQGKLKELANAECEAKTAREEVARLEGRIEELAKSSQQIEKKEDASNADSNTDSNTDPNTA